MFHGDIVSHRWELTLQNLPEEGYFWDTLISPREINEVSATAAEPVEGLVEDVVWQGSLVRKGQVFRLTGQWQACIRRTCCRCLRSFDWHVAGNLERDFQLGVTGPDECMDDVLDPPGHISLVDILREEIWLSWRSDVICREDCAGLCSGCGVNLNASSCRCKKVDDDHPFAVLRQLDLGKDH